MILVEVKWSQLFVNLGHNLIVKGTGDILVVLEREGVISLGKEAIQSFPNIDLYLIHSELPITYLHLIFGHVDVERLQILFNVSDLLMKVKLLVVELYVVVTAYVAHKSLDKIFKAIHLLSELVLLTDVGFPRFI